MYKRLTAWLQSEGIKGEIVPLRGDASLRRYYRITEGVHRGIVMDASAQPESVVPFVDISHRLQEAGVRTPEIYASDLEAGFLFLEDIGERHLIDMNEEERAYHYPKAIEMIATMQESRTAGLPLYDRSFLLSEMELMREWYLDKYLQISIPEATHQVLTDTFASIADVVLEQPQGCFVHRDFHARNLMLDSSDHLVVIDFQDARVGALTYDLVSLLRDVYLSLPPVKVAEWALYFRDRVQIEVDDETFLRWFDFTGMQRHIKILGIFARLALRDGKEGYLSDIPQTLHYLTEVAGKYEETVAFVEILKNITIEEG